MKYSKVNKRDIEVILTLLMTLTRQSCNKDFSKILGGHCKGGGPLDTDFVATFGVNDRPILIA